MADIVIDIRRGQESTNFKESVSQLKDCEYTWPRFNESLEKTRIRLKKERVVRKNRDVKCEWLTNHLDKIFVQSITLVWRKVASVIRAIFSNIIIFFAYIRILIKTKKSKACPYFIFEKGRDQREKGK